LVLLGFVINFAYKKLAGNYFSERSRVLRFLKNNPEIIESILLNNEHRYYNLTKMLKDSGKLVVDLSSGMIEIEGKSYSITLKK